MSDILYIVPAYNEEMNIEQVLESIKENRLPSSDILVVDDGSDDDTSEIVRRKDSVKIVEHPVNLGGGNAVKTGFKYAVRNGYEYTVQIDGDGQHNPEYAENALEKVKEGPYDMCIGSRFLDTPGYNLPFIRKIGIKTYSKVVSYLSGHKITDCTSGYRAVHRNLFSKFADNYPGSFCTIESLIWCCRHGYQVVEVPVEMNERTDGESYLKPSRMLKYPFSMFYSVIRAL